MTSLYLFLCKIITFTLARDEVAQERYFRKQELIDQRAMDQRGMNQRGMEAVEPVWLSDG